MDIHFGNLNQLHWLWLVAACVAAAVFAAVARRRAQTRFATANLVRRLLPSQRTFRSTFGTILVAAAMALLVVALIDVRWGKVWHKVPQRGIEVMFVLDVSRSMLAEDVTPNRLERAKQQIKDTLDEMAGDRVGLFVFAGDAKQQIPLTTHYDDFKQALDGVGPQNVRRGGSRLGDAIDAASHGFLTKSNAHKAMVVFTDGEDQESKPIEAARRAHAETGVRIFTVGLGDMEKGARIPIGSDERQDYVTYDGQQVWSKLRGDILRQVATVTGGAYIPAGTKQVNMADVYHHYIAGVEQEQVETARISQYEPRFQWFVAASLLLLLIEIGVTTWPVASVRSLPATGNPNRGESSGRRTRSARSTEHSTAA
ncbi:MAG TPA: VWA domain-containing protein [Lacipirellulaceae bacterium]|nr:VWA domain-containing protein [Lacipirellulaceae bacterium]